MASLKLDGFSKYKLLTVLVIFYLLSRFINLKSLPIFNDEATYIDWAWRMINLKGEFYYSVAHAKPPLFMWVVGVVRKIIADPLVAGRTVAIISGVLSVIGVYKLAALLFNKKVALFAIIFYTIIPIFVFYDRQALMESSVTAAGIWSLYFFLKLLRYQKYRYGIFLGLTLGIGYLVKTNAILYIIPLVVFYLLEVKRSNENRDTIISNGILIVSTLLISVSPLLLNNTFWHTLGNNKDYILTFSELAKFPFTLWFKNLKDFSVITLMYLNPITVILGLTSIYKSFKEGQMKNIYAAVYLITGGVLVVILSRSVIPRHVVSFYPIALIFAADSLVSLLDKIKTLAITSLIIIGVPSLILSSLLIFSPIKYFYLLDKISPFSLKEEYVSHWSSGYGIEEVVSFLKKTGNNTPIIVGVRLDAGNPENSIFAYFEGSEKIIVTYLDAQMIRDFESYDCLSSRLPTYFVSRDNQLAGLNKHLEEIRRVYKPEGKHYIGIYRAKTDCTGKKTLNLY